MQLWLMRQHQSQHHKSEY